MRIDLFIGEGWTPFTLGANETMAWPLPNANRLDLSASAEKLAHVFEERVRNVYPDADVTVRPEAEGGGLLCAVDLDDTADETADDARPLTSDDLEDDGFSPAALIEGEIAGLLDGIIQERTHTWKVER